MKNIILRAAALIIAVICIIPLSACGRNTADGDKDGIHGDDNGKTTDGINGDESHRDTDGTNDMGDMTDRNDNVTGNDDDDRDTGRDNSTFGDMTDDGMMDGNDSVAGGGNNVDPELGIGTDGNGNDNGSGSGRGN